MKNAKKLLALGLSVAMIFGVVACGNDTPANAGTESTPATESSEVVETPEVKEPVLLEWYFRGNGQQEDTDKVEARVNELLKEYPGLEHVSININCFTSSDYGTQVTLAQTSGAQIDILNSVSIDFAQHVEDGSWMPLNDLISDELYAELPEWLWELGSVEGNIYMVPNYQNAFNAGYIFFPKEYMDKYGNYDEMYATLTNWDLSITERLACLEEFTMAVRAGEGNNKYAGGVGTIDKGQLGFFFMEPYDHLSSHFVIPNDGEHKVEYLWTSDEMKEIYSVMADWNDKGIKNPDGADTSDADYNNQNMMNDVSYVFSPKEQVGDADYVASIYTDAWGFELVAIPVQEYNYVQNSWGAGGNGVSATCEHPEEAIAFIEALTTGTELGKEIYNTVVFGLEGEHYTKDAADPNRITTLEYDGSQGGTATTYAGLKWILGNSFYAYKNQAVKDGQFENIKKYNEAPETQSSDHNGFVVSTANVTAQLEQIGAVTSEYKDLLYKGTYGVAEWEAKYNEYVAKLEKAGIQDVIDDFQKQLDDWMAANGK